MSVQKLKKPKTEDYIKFFAFYTPTHNDHVFRQRNTDLKFWLALIAIMVLVGILGHSSALNARLKQEIRLRQGVSTHLWLMTDSCSEQLLNSNDHTLRIKLK